MHNQPILTDRNFTIYAAQHYDNPNCVDTSEWIEDLRRIKYVKKLITRYIESGILKERLILNHLIVLSNVFAPEPLIRILFLKMEEQMRYLKPFLILLGIFPEKVYNVKTARIIDTNLIDMDPRIIAILRNI